MERNNEPWYALGRSKELSTGRKVEMAGHRSAVRDLFRKLGLAAAALLNEVRFDGLPEVGLRRREKVAGSKPPALKTHFNLDLCFFKTRIC